MSWQTIVFIFMLAILVVGTTVVSYSGAMLPATDQVNAFSMKNVQSRRTHFMRYYAFGK